MKISAQERGRRLHITVGGSDEGMTEQEAAEADRDAIHVTVPPVSAAVGMRIWALYAGIMFNEVASDVEADATELVRMATGCYFDPEAPYPDDAARATAQAAADQQQAIMDGLRWEEGNAVSEVAIYWNVQGGGIDAAMARIEDGNPKAQEILTRRNGLWGVLSRLRTLRDSGVDALMNELDGTNGTSTPAGG